LHTIVTDVAFWAFLFLFRDATRQPVCTQTMQVFLFYSPLLKCALLYFHCVDSNDSPAKIGKALWKLFNSSEQV